MHGVFVTGTDTGVGKTHIGTAAIKALVARGIHVVPRKPIESGCLIVGEELFPADAAALHAAAGEPGSLKDACPYRLREPLSPARAARLEGKHLSIADLERAALSGFDRESFLWVEGAGGFYSPLASDGLNADLAARLCLPVLLIAADRLGCINHVLLTAEAIGARGLRLRAVVLNRTNPQTTPEMDNAEDLKERIDFPIVSIGYREPVHASHPQLARLAELLLDLHRQRESK